MSVELKFINNLKEIRQIKGLSQQKLADKAGISRQTVLEAENGNVVPGTFTSLRIAKVLDCTVEDIFLRKLSYMFYKEKSSN